MLRRRLLSDINDVYEGFFGFHFLTSNLEPYGGHTRIYVTMYLTDDVYNIDGTDTIYKVKDIVKSVIFYVSTGVNNRKIVFYDYETYNSTKSDIEYEYRMDSQYGLDFYIAVEWKLPISEILRFCNVIYINLDFYYVVDDGEDTYDDYWDYHIIGDIRSLLYGENVKGKKIPSSVLHTDHGLLYENMLGQMVESLISGCSNPLFYEINGYDGTSPERYLRNYINVIPNKATKPRWQLYFRPTASVGEG